MKRSIRRRLTLTSRLPGGRPCPAIPRRADRISGRKGCRMEAKPVRGSRRRRPAALAVILALLGVPAVAGCSGQASSVVLARGHAGMNKPWQLTASERSGTLGLYLGPPKGASYSGAQGFDASPADGFWAEGAGPGNTIFYYGPAPASATQIRLSAPGHPSILVPTRPFPPDNGLPRGRFFIAEPPGPTVSWNVTLLDAAGHRVASAKF